MTATATKPADDPFTTSTPSSEIQDAKQHANTPKSRLQIPGSMPLASPELSSEPGPRDTPTSTALPWKLWRPGSSTSSQDVSPGQQEKGHHHSASGNNNQFLDFVSLPSLNLSSLNPLSFLSRPSSGPSPSNSRQATPRPLAASHLGAPFEESPPRPQESQNLTLDDHHAGNTVTVPDAFAEQPSPSPTVERPRISLNTTRLSRRPSESPASPQFRQAESATSMDPTTLHAIARASSEGDALRAVSERHYRDRNRSSLSSMERKAAVQPLPPQSTATAPQTYQDTYGKMSARQQSSQQQQSSQYGGPLVDAPEQANFSTTERPTDEAALNRTIADERKTLQWSAENSGVEDVTAEKTEAGSEDKPAGKKGLLKRLGFSRFPSTSNTLTASPNRSREASNATVMSSDDMADRKHSRILSHTGIASELGMAPTSSRASRRFSVSSVSTTDSHGEAPSAKSARAPKLHRVKTKCKNKEAREFGHLFLAQELRLDPPVPSLPTSSIKGSPSLESAASLNPLDSQASLPLSSVAPSSEFGHYVPPMTSTTSVTGKKKPAVWAMEFSKDGQYLAVAGHDAVVRVWKVLSSPSSAEEQPRASSEQEHLADDAPLAQVKSTQQSNCRKKSNRVNVPVFEQTPCREYVGHSGDVLDLSWSKNNFLLTSSMDKTVRLWHVSRPECLCIFQHSDFVTSVVFHPQDDRYFLSGSLDCRLRLWSVPNKRLHAWTELDQLVTSVAFSADGRTAMSGSFSGQVMLFDVDNLAQKSAIEAKSSRGKNQGKKITHLDCIPSSTPGIDHLLVTSNDSRLRMYNTQDKTLEAKFSGHENASSQIRASFSDDGRFIICGSEDGQVYIWDSGIGGSKEDVALAWMARKKPVAGCEFFSAEGSITTCALIAPSETKQHLKDSGDPILNGTVRDRSGSVASSIRTGLSRTTSAASEAEPQALPLPGRGRAETVEDAIIVTADDTSGILRIYRNSAYSANGGALYSTPTTNSRYLRPSSIASSNNTPSRRASRASPFHTPELS